MASDNAPTNILNVLHKESLDIYNRLHSIAEDITFVNQVHEAYPDLPLLPNLRCGAWYTDPQVATDIPAYFKSTDGHYNNWGFNLRRANLHLLNLVLQRRGMVIVDSTRSGKRMPDALSKTIPIWCAVINRVIRRVHRKEGWDVDLYTPPGVVSQQEHQQIERKLDSWADALEQSSFSLPNLERPLRPVWITPATTIFPFRDSISYLEFYPFLCVSASRQIQEALERRSGFTYVQGSGDDHELWGMGLTPEMFWRHKQPLLETPRADLPDRVRELLSRSSSIKNGTHASPIEKVGGLILVSTLADVSYQMAKNVKYDLLRLDPDLLPTAIPQQESPAPGTYATMSVPIQEGKKGAGHFFQVVLPHSLAFIHARLYLGRSVCIACPDGKDLSVGVGVAALQKFFHDDGKLSQPPKVSTPINKNTIRTRLEWIIASRPEANPSRITLKRVHDYFLAPKHLRST